MTCRTIPSLTQAARLPRGRAKYLHAVGLLCSLAVAGAQQPQTAANTIAVLGLVQFAGTFHPPPRTPGGPIGADAETIGGLPPSAFALAGASAMAVVNSAAGLIQVLVTLP